MILIKYIFFLFLLPSYSFRCCFPFSSLFRFLLSLLYATCCSLLCYTQSRTPTHPNPKPTQPNLCLLPHHVPTHKQQVRARISLFRITSHSSFGSWNSRYISYVRTICCISWNNPYSLNYDLYTYMVYSLLNSFNLKTKLD